MRKPTQEQKDAAAARRAKMRALAKTISDMDVTQRASLAARMPVTTIEGRALSVFNSCFVATQSPNATVVGGFRQWLKAGRCVRKGEHGIAIWVPCKARESDGTDGEADETRFILGTVFDVSQTIECETGNKAETDTQPAAQPITGEPEYSTEFTPM